MPKRMVRQYVGGISLHGAGQQVGGAIPRAAIGIAQSLLVVAIRRTQSLELGRSYRGLVRLPYLCVCQAQQVVDTVICRI